LATGENKRGSKKGGAAVVDWNRHYVSEIRLASTYYRVNNPGLAS
jgi:hypothetical protein